MVPTVWNEEFMDGIDIKSAVKQHTATSEMHREIALCGAAECNSISSRFSCQTHENCGGCERGLDEPRKLSSTGPSGGKMEEGKPLDPLHRRDSLNEDVDQRVVNEPADKLEATNFNKTDQETCRK